VRPGPLPYRIVVSSNSLLEGWPGGWWPWCRLDARRLDVVCQLFHAVVCPAGGWRNWLLWPNGWMDEDATWYGSRPRPRPHCIRRGPSSPQQPRPLFSAHVYCGHGRPSRLLLSSCNAIFTVRFNDKRYMWWYKLHPPHPTQLTLLQYLVKVERVVNVMLQWDITKENYVKCTM